jgi:ribosomal protein S18 acetylase RimI-like enzyme
MEIRPAKSSEESALIALWAACGLTVPYNDPAADFRFASDKSNSDVLVAEQNGTVVGSIMVGHDGHRGWLYYVAVTPTARRQGIGRALVSAAEQWLKQRGVPKVHLMVRESNPEVAAFYNRVGYEPMPRINFQKWLKA